MSHENSKGKPKPIAFLFEYSGFLIVGAVAALAWANLDPDRYENGERVYEGTYTHFINFEFKHLFYDPEPEHGDEHHAAGDQGHDDDAHEDGNDHTDAHEPTDGDHAVAADDPASGDEPATGDVAAGGEADGEDASEEPDPADTAESHEEHGHSHPLNIAFFVNDVLMAFFFAIAGKEVWEALLPGGPLSNPRKAATPLLATLGGIIGPAGLYIIAVLIMGQWPELGRGWAIPCATDIAFSYLVARLIFGTGHPAIAFLLLLAIADDAAGLVIIAVAYPSGDLNLIWLLLTVGAIGLAIAFRYMRITNFWWYLLIPGTMSWFSFYMSGIHAALGLVPIIPTLPAATSDLGIFARNEKNEDDTLNAFEHWWKNPVEIFLGLFGLVNAGVVFSSAGYGTAWVLLGLLIGKPLGITLFAWLGQKAFKLEIPGGMTYRHIVTLGMVAGIGFTVALFVSTAAFGNGPREHLDATKMGALLSFGAAILAFVLGRALGIRPESGGGNPDSEDKESEPSTAAT